MKDFDFGLDIEAEIAGIRGHRDKPQRPQPTPVQVRPERQAVPRPQPNQGGQSGQPNSGTQVSEKPAPSAPSHSYEQGGGESAPAPVPAPVPVPTTKEPVEQKQTAEPSSTIDWKRFKTLPGIFEHVGGDRPVRLHPSIKKSQVSGIPEPMIGAVQKYLMEKHTGAVVGFPWGEYQITEKNRVFTTKSSLMRYLLFDSFRDASGTHVQYAKQWMVLQHPVFDRGFNPDTHLGVASDELDIYALLFVSHTSEEYTEAPTQPSNHEQDYQTAERLGMLNMSIGRVLDKMNEHEKMLREHAERSTLIETVILLDRMGLLVGGLPRDVGEFVRVLESNRDTISATNITVTDHMQAEKERQKTLMRQERMRQMQQRQN